MKLSAIVEMKLPPKHRNLFDGIPRLIEISPALLASPEPIDLFELPSPMEVKFDTQIEQLQAKDRQIEMLKIRIQELTSELDDVKKEKEPVRWVDTE